MQVAKAAPFHHQCPLTTLNFVRSCPVRTREKNCFQLAFFNTIWHGDVSWNKFGSRIGRLAVSI